MQKKLTITIDDEVYEGLHRLSVRAKSAGSSRNWFARTSYVPILKSAYAEMARDKKREKEAVEWAEATFKDVAHETA